MTGSHFGTTSGGRDVRAITRSAHGLTFTVLTYGAILQSVKLEGLAHSVTLGSDAMADYEGTMCYYGAIIGPVANRISGAKAVIDGIEYQFERNFMGKHLLHSGKRGTHARMWTVADETDDSVTLALDLRDGEDGFPGNRRMTARFGVTAGPTLTLDITTVTDAPTLVNATNHSYWCLDGTGKMDRHQLQLRADDYLPTTSELLPTGDRCDVSDTAYDFRTPRTLPPGAPPLDNTFCVATARRPLTEVLTLSTTDVSMTVSTTEAGVHIFDDRDRYRAIAIEAQSWPDATTHRDFPSILVGPDTPCIQTTHWQFERL